MRRYTPPGRTRPGDTPPDSSSLSGPWPRPWGARGRPVQQQPVPGPAAWLTEHGTGAGRLSARLRTRDCRNSRKRCAPAASEHIRQPLAQGVPACIHCRPDTTPEVLECPCTGTVEE
ncbi:DUF6233 domain-containing protein [Streptomyces sp. NRRL F-2664]|uniref:DUF6233 domain-containing protein n=1 Tax=Streptomyces sp. NRRL F-2664 TaxID=1463842 RepID=UPI003B63B497